MKRECGEVIEIADDQMRMLGKRYYVQRKVVEPAVFTTLTDNWINLNVRYPTMARQRRATANRISRAVLEMVEASDDIDIASATFDIVGFPPVKLEQGGEKK